MEDKDLENIRRKKMKEAYAQMQEKEKVEKEVASIARQFLTPDAYERLMNVKISNPELYVKVVEILARYGTRLKKKMDDEELVALLRSLLPERRETKIQFKRKGGINGKY